MKNKKILYKAESFPVFQNQMYPSHREAVDCPKGDICLVEDMETGLVFNDTFDPGLMIYGVDYQNEQGMSPYFQRHLDSMARIIRNTMGKKNLVEIGCGKGKFIDILTNQGLDVAGFDPAYEGNNPKIIKSYFQPGKVSRTDGFILRHVLEHIQNPLNFLAELKESNGGKGLIFIEVPCFEWICRHRAWFDIFYEHVNYFRLSDFHRLFGRILKSGKVFGGQYMYVVADLSSLKKPLRNPGGCVDFPSDLLHTLNTKNGKVIWGGGSKGVIFAYLKQRLGAPVEVVIDINPAKQGKFIAGTGLRVMTPKEGLRHLDKGATLYVMNSNYLSEIKEMSDYAYNYVSVDHV